MSTVGQESILVEAQNDEDLDEQAITDAFAAIRTNGGGEIVIKGMLIYNKALNLFTMPRYWSMRGAWPLGCGFRVGTNAWFYNNYNVDNGVNPTNTWYPATQDLIEGQMDITFPLSGPEIVAGDLIYMRSTDQVPYVPPHNGPSGHQMPNMIRKALHCLQTGNGYEVSFDRDIPYPLTVAKNFEYRVVPRNSQMTAIIEDLTFTRQRAELGDPNPVPTRPGGTGTQTNCWGVRDMIDSEMNNIIFDSAGPFSPHGYNLHIHNFKHIKEDEAADDDGTSNSRYVITSGDNGVVTFHNTQADGVNHTFTTGGSTGVLNLGTNAVNKIYNSGNLVAGGYPDLATYLIDFPDNHNNRSYFWNTTTQTMWGWTGAAIEDLGRQVVWPDHPDETLLRAYKGRGGSPTITWKGGEIFHQAGKEGLHCHAEGADCLFEGVTVNCMTRRNLSQQSTRSGNGGASRAFRTTFLRCHIRGDANGHGFKSRGPFTRFEQCLIEGVGTGVILEKHYVLSGYTNPGSYGAVVKENTFRNIRHCCIQLQDVDPGGEESDNILIAGNWFEEGNIFAGGANPNNALIMLGNNGTGHRIIDNHMPKGAHNDTAIDLNDNDMNTVLIAGNSGLQTYDTDMGLAGTHARTVAAKSRGQNLSLLH